MSSKLPMTQLQLGRRIDNALELVEVLGVGGYGVVYRAVDTCSPSPQSYAVKCLPHSQLHPSLRRQTHIREIALHQISSAHPGVVSLHRVVEDNDYTYMIMDYAPDHDLFTQILNKALYIGNDELIKHVFLQLLDAVEYCHSLGIYHRDLKPENVLCFDDGYRIAITDFGLATTEKMSSEFRTGSIYHMSPECHGGEFAPDGTYSPMFNDVWSLGIVLLNIATGRNPWKTATVDDLSFQAYLRDPLRFFPSILPISLEMNELLVQMLHVDWTERMTLAELRQEIEDIGSFYSPDAVFKGSQALCAWEAGMMLESVPSIHEEHRYFGEGPESQWSEDSCPDIGFTNHIRVADSVEWDEESEPFTLQLLGSKSQLGSIDTGIDRHSSQRSSNYSYFSYSASPPTPDSVNDGLASGQNTVQDTVFDEQTGDRSLESPCPSVGDIDPRSNQNGYPPSFFFTRPSTSLDAISHQPSAILEDENTPPAWISSESPVAFNSIGNSDIDCEAESITGSIAPSPDALAWSYAPTVGSSIYTSHGFDDNEATAFTSTRAPRPSYFTAVSPNGPPNEPSGALRDFTDTWLYTPTFPKTAPAWPWVGIPPIQVSPMYPDAQLDHHWRLSSVSPARYWFSPIRLFTSPVVS